MNEISLEACLTNTPQPAIGLRELLPPLTTHEAAVESARCLMCFDAPCTHACPTHIDIPKFIKKIATGNLRGSARASLESNLAGPTGPPFLPGPGAGRGGLFFWQQTKADCDWQAAAPRH